MTRTGRIGRLAALMLAGAVALSGCSDDTRVNIATGAVIGGLAGSAIGGGIVTLGGAAAGAVAGSQSRLNF
jgi:outer membrane lipoprotein SlyB